jgi:hypothetical protein
MKSIFTDKSKTPTETDLKKSLGNTYQHWKHLVEFTHKYASTSTNEWHYSGDKYGWSFRIRDSKRVLIYLLPRDKFFKTAFVFGQKATDEILAGTASESIKNELSSAKVYAEGRGIRIEVKSKAVLKDIERLITIKLLH